jgi:nitrile hydratase
VQTASVDTPHHTRLPRYARGATGTVVELHGEYPLPDLKARCLPAEPEPVYTVAFTARDLFGEGDHAVTVDLWHSYLRQITPEEGQ